LEHQVKSALPRIIFEPRKNGNMDRFFEECRKLIEKKQMLESSLAVVYKRFIVSFCALQAFSIVFPLGNIENKFD